MTTKADFNAEEWETVTQGPLLAGTLVAAAHRGGTIRESVAMAKAYTEARKQQGASELLDQLAASPPAVQASRLQQGGDLESVVTGHLREAVGILEPKATPEDVEAYKDFVVHVAMAAAEAHKEGGFLGIGGEHISAEEKKALDKIAAVLGIDET